MKTFIEKLPKAELHLHIEGSFEPELMFKIAQRNKIDIPYKSVEEIEKAYKFDCLQDFLNIYYQGAGVLVNEQDFYDLTYSYLQKCADQNVRHTEIMFDPQTHTDRGIAFETVINGISKACDDAKIKLGVSSLLIMSYLRHLSEEDAFKTLNQSLPFKAKITAVGLDSSEKGNPPSKFKNVFEASIKEIIKRDIALTVCPLSNTALRVVDDLKNHPLKKMMDLGLKVTVNSDDPAYFGGQVNKNYMEIQKALNLSKADLYQLAKNSFQYSLLDENIKLVYLNELEVYFNNNK
jgi:adenosine deaminase